MALTQLVTVALLLASAANAQNLFCPVLGGAAGKYNWSPDFYPTVTVQTTTSSAVTYLQNFNCYFVIEANIPGRVVVSVTQSDLSAFSASISIRTDLLSGYMADWSQLTYSEDRHKDFVSITNRLYISFNSYNSPFGLARGVRLSLTFLKSTACLPYWTPMVLAGQNHCVGRPIVKTFQFGEAQRYCNLQRSNLLVSDRDNVSSVLTRANAANVWIGMTAEPSGTYSSYIWINKSPMSAGQPVSCTGGCKPGSTTHRCVYAQDQRTLTQIECSQRLQPLCYMPAGGTDVFYAGSGAVRASGALLAGAALLFWSLLR